MSTTKLRPTKLRPTITLTWLAMLSACSSVLRPPDWQLNARGASERAVDAYMTGQTRIETLEFDKARAEVARTGDPSTLARIELLRCATQVASLVQENCAAFDAIAQDATPVERAYAHYLAGRLNPADIALLPPQHQAVSRSGATALGTITDPLSRLVAAGVLFKTGRADASAMVLATDTASAQGWSRPLVAWLQVRVQRAEDVGDPDEAARLKRRIALVLQTPNL